MGHKIDSGPRRLTWRNWKENDIEEKKKEKMKEEKEIGLRKNTNLPSVPK